MKLYKLTTQDGKTRPGQSNETQWGEGVTHTAKGTGGLCTDGVIHAYTSPLLAVLLNPSHANIKDPILWEAKGKIVKSEPCKCGVKTLTTIRQIPLPEISTEQKIRFAIGCALTFYKNSKFKIWALNWLANIDRSYTAANAAYAAANAANDAAKAVNAAYADVNAAYAAANAANAAARASHFINLLKIAEWAMTEEPWNE